MDQNVKAEKFEKALSRKRQPVKWENKWGDKELKKKNKKSYLPAMLYWKQFIA